MGRLFVRACLFLGALAGTGAGLAGCSGGGGTGDSLPRPASGSPVSATAMPPAPVATAASQSTATIVFRIASPLAGPAAARRRPAYVSPATNSVSIAQNGGTPQVVSLATGSGACTTANGTRTCAISFAAMSGANQSFAVKAFASSDGSGVPLSLQTIVATILQGRSNQIAVTLDGVVASLSVALLATSFTAGVPAQTSVVVGALDASGNAIVGPGVFADANGNPIVVALTDTDTSGATSLAQKTVTSASNVVLSYDGATPPASLNVTASAPSLASSAATLSFRAAGGALSGDAVAALSDLIENYYQTLPHTDPVADVAAVESYMTASGQFTNVALSPGGIVGTLSDGSPFLVFADLPEELTASAASSARKRRTPLADPAPEDPPLSPATSHEVAFMVAEYSGDAFDPSVQRSIQRSVYDHFPAANYGVDRLNISLENLLAIGNGHALDYLDIATHGMIFPTASGVAYANLSQTPVSSINSVTYHDDLVAGNLRYGLKLSPLVHSLSAYAFTSSFLAKHLVFNPGAVVDNESCFGANPTIVAADDATLSAAGVGVTLGWTKIVAGTLADEGQEFLFDRLLGEIYPDPEEPYFGIESEVTQRVPAQRAFPFTDVYGAMGDETRANSPNSVAPSESYTVSDVKETLNTGYQPTADGTASRLVLDAPGRSAGMAAVPDALVVPTISQMAVAEKSPSSTLTIRGTFPKATGSISLATAAGTQTLPLVSWSTTSIVASLPASGPSSAGNVVVLSSLGVPSNPVPLTYWHAKMTYGDTAIPGQRGDAAGGLALSFDLGIRADVHPVVTTIDTNPLPQNFNISGLSQDSTGSFDSFATSYVETVYNAPVTATYALKVPGNFVPFSLYEPPGIDTNGGFGLSTSFALPGCNDAKTEAGGANPNVACPSFTWDIPNAATCTPSDPKDVGVICAANNSIGLSGGYGGSTGPAAIYPWVLDSATYALSVAPVTGSYNSPNYGIAAPSTIAIDVAADAPLSPPTMQPSPSPAPAPTPLPSGVTFQSRAR